MTYFIAFFIGIWGYVNVGVINIGIVDASAQHHRKTLISLILCAFVCEILYCFGILFGLKYILANDFLKNLLRFLSILSCFLLAFLAFQSVKSTQNQPNQAPKNTENQSKKSLFYAYFAMIIHPQQFSFWGIWGLYLLQNGYISDNFWEILGVAFEAGLGALSFFVFLSYLGRVFIAQINTYRANLYYFTAILMCFLGLNMILRLF